MSDQIDLNKMTPNEAAAYWDARLRSTKKCEEFDAWRKKSSVNAQSFNSLQKVLKELHATKGHPKLRSLRDSALAQVSPVANISKRIYPKVFASIAASIFILVGLVFLINPNFQTNEKLALAKMDVPPYYSTTLGERSTVTLDDGSTATLNTNTRIKVDYSKEKRLIRLLKGQAFFDVAKNPNRPFLVEAGKQRIKAIGTIFDVRFDVNKQVQVTLLEGIIEVDPIGEIESLNEKQAKIRSHRLVAGQQLIAPVNKSSVVKKTDVAKVISWRSGRITFEDISLTEAIKEMNRYSNKKIVTIDNYTLSKFRINGMFRTGNQLSFVEALEQSFPIKVKRSNKNIIEVRAL